VREQDAAGAPPVSQTVTTEGHAEHILPTAAAQAAMNTEVRGAASGRRFTWARRRANATGPIYSDGPQA